jgi:hypothetical protein
MHSYSSSPVYSQCIRAKKSMMEAMESKLDNGMDRCIFIKKFTSRERGSACQ